MGYNKSELININGVATELTIGGADDARSRAERAFIRQVIGQPFALIQVIPFVRDNKGNIVYAADGRPVLNTGLRKNIGPGIAPYQMGLTNTFNLNKFTFSFLVDAKFGGYMHSGTNHLAYARGLHKETLPGRETGIVGEGVNQSGSTNTVSVPAYTWYPYLTNFGEPFIYKSDFVKLRSVIIGYTIPIKTLGKVRFQSATVSLVGRNLWIIHKEVPIIDPESAYNVGSNQGLEFAGMPSTRTFGVNLNLKF
jgi:hypothetical protein